jgi:hypothetical protein
MDTNMCGPHLQIVKWGERGLSRTAGIRRFLLSIIGRAALAAGRLGRLEKGRKIPRR